MNSRGSWSAAKQRGFRALQWVYRHHAAVYFLVLGAFSAVFVSLIIGFAMNGQTPGIRLFTALLLLVPVSQLAIEVVNYLVTRLLPPRTLPKMDFEDSGIPDAFRTLVVVPMMLADEETIRAEVEKLEIRYLANKEANLLFSLFPDYTDSHRLRVKTTPAAADRDRADRRLNRALRRRAFLPVSPGTHLERIRAEIHRLGAKTRASWKS